MAQRDLPAAMADRLIVALDVPSIAEAQHMATRLHGTVRFFKLGMWLMYAPGFDQLLDSLISAGNQVFLDAKMYDIPETVAHGIAAAAARGVSFVTIHGDAAIIRAAVAARGASPMKIFAVTVLTSLDDSALADMGYSLGARALVEKRARDAVLHGCDGIIASADDNPDTIRALAGGPGLLVTTPGIRQATGSTNDHKRPATPTEAIRNGADYLVVGRPIVKAPDPVAAARAIIAEMEQAARG